MNNISLFRCISFIYQNPEILQAPEEITFNFSSIKLLPVDYNGGTMVLLEDGGWLLFQKWEINQVIMEGWGLGAPEFYIRVRDTNNKVIITQITCIMQAFIRNGAYKHCIVPSLSPGYLSESLKLSNSLQWFALLSLYLVSAMLYLNITFSLCCPGVSAWLPVSQWPGCRQSWQLWGRGRGEIMTSSQTNFKQTQTQPDWRINPIKQTIKINLDLDQGKGNIKL